MPLLTRYVVWEFLKVFSVALGALTLVMLLYGLGKEALNQGLGPLEILLILPYVLPEMMRFILPATVLFAACFVFGRMSSSNEITAAKSLGISPMVFLWPVYVLCVALSLCSVWVNELAVTWGRQGVQRVVLNSLEDIVYRTLRAQKTYSSRKFSVIVKGVEGRRLLAPVFTFEASAGSPAVTVRVEEATLRTDPAAGTLTIVCRNGTLDVPGQVTARIADVFERTLSLEDAGRNQSTSGSPGMMPLPDIHQEVAATRRQINELEQQLAAQAAQCLLSGDYESLTGEPWTSRENLLHYWGTYVARLTTEPYRRWANGFSCLGFALVGAPLAIRLRNSDYLRTFGYCFFPILFVYYPLMMLGVNTAKHGQAPPLVVWLGNLVLAAVGYWLGRKVLRY